MSHDYLERLYLEDADELGIKATPIERTAVIRHMKRYHDAIRFLKEYNEVTGRLGKTPALSVLDVGCGSGYGTSIIRKHFTLVDGVDVCIKALQYASKRYVGINWCHPDYLPKASNYDAGFFIESVEHMEPQWLQTYLKKIRKCIVVTTPLVATNDNHHHLKTDYVMYEGPVMTITKRGKVVPFFVQSLSDAKQACDRRGVPGRMACYFMPE